jgi:putative membrane protein
MLRPWLTDSGRQVLTEAVAHIESLSAVELLVVVRRRARAWPHVPWLAGNAAAWVLLAAMLFSAPVFPLWSFLVFPPLLGAIVGWAAGRLSAPIRWLTRPSTRRAAVQASAGHTFVSRGVHGTRGRTGVLVYCALGERMVAVVADTGVLAAVPAATLSGWETRIEQALGRSASHAADVVASLAPVFASALPRLMDDLNELPDELAPERGQEGPL